MGMIPPKLSKEIRNKFNTIRKEAARTVYIYTAPEQVDCPNCLSDYTGASLGTFDSSFVTPVFLFDNVISPINFSRGRCPVCNALGYIEGSAKTGIKTLVRWNPSGEDSKGDLENTAGGLEGFNVVQLKAAKCYYDILRDAEKAVIDGVECTLLKPPVYRTIGEVEISVIAYFVSTSVGHTIRE